MQEYDQRTAHAFELNNQTNYKKATTAHKAVGEKHAEHMEKKNKFLKTYQNEKLRNYVENIENFLKDRRNLDKNRQSELEFKHGERQKTFDKAKENRDE